MDRRYVYILRRGVRRNEVCLYLDFGCLVCMMVDLYLVVVGSFYLGLWYWEDIFIFGCVVYVKVGGLVDDDVLYGDIEVLV